MSAAFIWIFFPLIASGGLYLLRRWEKTTHLVGLLIAILLTILALALPIGQAIPIRIWSQIPPVFIKGSIPWLGARLTIEEHTRPMLVLLYLASVAWFGGAYVSRLNRLLIPLGLGVAGILSAAFSITPNIYANLLILLAAIVCIPIFSPPGRPLQRGVRRFLTFQTLGMGLIFLANLSILLATIQSELQIDLTVPAFVLGLGYGLVLPIFPFHTWVSLISEKSEPYSSTYVLFLLPAANAYLILTTMLRLDIRTIFPTFFNILQITAVMMIFLGGVWAALENHLGKMIGFVIMHQIGFALLALSAETGDSLAFVEAQSLHTIQDASANSPFAGLFFAHFLPAGVSLAVLALSLSVLQKQLPRPNQDTDLQIQDIRGIIRQYPFASTGMLVSLLSLGGLPVLASFPIYLPLWSNLVRASILLAAFSLLGSGFLFLSGARIFNALIEKSETETWKISETGLQALLLGVGILAILILGLIPNLYLPYLTKIALSVTNPIP